MLHRFKVPLPSTKKIYQNFTKYKNRIPKRFVIVAMVFFGYGNIFYLHTNMAMAVVEMTSPKNITNADGNVALEPEFKWNSKEKGVVLSTFSYGRLLGPIGGILAGRIGGATLFGVSILVTAVVTLSTPFLLYNSFSLFVITNVILGVFEAFQYASISQLWSRWAPPDERSKFVSFSVIGLYMGNIIAFLIAGWMLNQWAWPWLFYISGGATLAWYGIWLLVVSNDPEDDKHISEAERAYIKETLNSVSANEKLVYPMKEILTCMPFWAGCLAKFSFGCGITFTTLYLPQYIKDTNDIDIKKIGYISTIPQMCSIISMPLSGYMSDYIRSNKILSVTNLHKLNMSLGCFIAFVVFLIPGKWPSFLVSMVCISTFQFFSTFVTVDVQVLVLDLAPKYAAFLNSISNVLFTSSGIVTPALVGFIVTSHSKEQWDICFAIFGGINLLVGLIFLHYGSGDLQPWANYTGKRVQPVENPKECCGM